MMIKGSTEIAAKFHKPAMLEQIYDEVDRSAALGREEVSFTIGSNPLLAQLLNDSLKANKNFTEVAVTVVTDEEGPMHFLRVSWAEKVKKQRKPRSKKNA